MLELAFCHPRTNGLLTAEYDADNGMVYSRHIEALDFLLGFIALDNARQPDLQALMYDMWGVMVPPLSDASLHPDDETETRILEHYHDLYVERRCKTENREVDDAQRKIEQSRCYVHTDPFILRYTRGEPSTLLITDRDRDAVYSLVREERFYPKRQTPLRKHFAYEENLARTMLYWCQAKPRCITAFRGAADRKPGINESNATAHVKPMAAAEGPRPFIRATIPSGTDIAILATYLPRIVSVRPMALNEITVKPLVLARERAPLPNLSVA